MKTPFLNLALVIVTLSLLIFSKISHQATPPRNNYDPTYPNPNPRLLKAYTALQAWKHAITSDPKNFTADWCGPNVCNYTGVFCAPAPDDPAATTVAGIDLNHATIAGTLPEELGLLSDLALFHINSNRFEGSIPESFSGLSLLHELDVSNNRLSGGFPGLVLSLRSLKFLDIRFNRFSGQVPPALFDAKLDAIFINDNDFRSSLPANFGNSTVSVVVLANNDLHSCLPASVAAMRDTLSELIITGSGLKGCLPPEVGLLGKLRVFDVSDNELAGTLPETMGEMRSLEQLNVAGNKLSGVIPAAICSLPRLENFTYSYNYFCGEPEACLKLEDKDDRKNCLPYRPAQRSPDECTAYYDHPVKCGAFGSSCPARSPPPLPSPPPPAYHYGKP